MEWTSMPGATGNALRITLLSALIAAVPAVVIGTAGIDHAGFRSAVEARVCEPGETIGFRMRTTASGRNQSAHCRGADGAYGERNVMLPVLWNASRIAWPPTTGAIALVWGMVAIARRGRDARAVTRPAPEPPGAMWRVEQVGSPGITRTVDEVTIQLGAEHAELVDRLVSSEQPNLDDVQHLLGSLRASGALPAGFGDARPDARGDDVGASLRQLRALRDEGLINRSEYDERRRAILERL